MRWLDRILRTLRGEPHQREVDEELQFHLAMREQKNLDEGMGEGEARRNARLRFGNPAVWSERISEVDLMLFLRTILEDLRYGLRQLQRNPGFAIVVVLTLALGIGLNTAVFSLIDAALLSPLPYPHAERLVVFLRTQPGSNGGSSASPAWFSAWCDQTRIFQDVSAFKFGLLSLNAGPESEPISYGQVTGAFFRLFGASVEMGRTFSEAEELPHGGHVVVLSNELWRRRFQGDPHIIGRSLSLGGQHYEVIGVLGSEFSRVAFPLVLGGTGPPDLWIPIQLNANSADYNTYFEVAGRLKGGVTLPLANAELRAAAAEYRRLNPRDISLGSTGSFGVQPLREFLNRGATSTLFLLLGAVSSVLLIACANVANLQLARSTARRQEFAVRAALGARRARVMRQLLTESWLLAAGGCTLGVLVGFAGIYGAVRVRSPEIAGISKFGSAVTMDWRLLLFTLLVSISTAVLFGIFPALQGSRVDVSETLKKSGGRIGTGFRQNKARSALVVCEIALALVLSVGAGLLVRTFIALHTVESGLNARNVLRLSVVLSGARFQKASGVSDTVQASLDRLGSVPGVESAGFTCCIPLEEGEPEGLINLVGRPLDAASSAVINTVSPDYFHVLGIPMMSGRAFSQRDDAGSTPVVIISERLARQFWPDITTLHAPLNAQVRTLDTPNLPPWQVVGIAGDVRAYGLRTDPPPILYIPVAQTPEDLNTYLVRNAMSWIVRTRMNPALVSAPVQNVLRQATGGLPVLSVGSMDEIVRQSAGSRDFNLLLMSIFALSALLLAGIGIYGVIAYSVEARTHEIGIRLAMGAQRPDVFRLVTGSGMMLASFGVAIGVAGSVFLTHFLKGWLYGVRPTDALTFVAVSLFLLAVSLMACSIPAYRAMKANPTAALRCE